MLVQPLLELPGGGSLGGLESEVLGRLSLCEVLPEPERLPESDVSRDTLSDEASLAGGSLGGFQSDVLGTLTLSDVEWLPDLDSLRDGLPERLWLTDPLGGSIVLSDGSSLLASLWLADSLRESDSLWLSDPEMLCDTLPETL